MVVSAHKSGQYVVLNLGVAYIVSWLGMLKFKSSLLEEVVAIAAAVHKVCDSGDGAGACRLLEYS